MCRGALGGGIGRLGRRLGVFALAVAAAGGCALAHKPHAGDPLLRHGRGLRGDLEKARLPMPAPPPEPAVPPPPAAGAFVSAE